MISKSFRLLTSILLNILVVFAQNNCPSTQAPCNPLEFQLRDQWQNNFGYCGEMSLGITALRLGQYFSQYDIRDFYNSGKWIGTTSQSSSQAASSNQFLIYYGTGTETTNAFSGFNMVPLPWSGPADTKSFLLWIKTNFLKGYGITIGVFTNNGNNYFGGDGGDSEYDHIVVVTDIISSYPNDVTNYYPTDQICINDHGIWGDNAPYQYIFCYTFDGFQATRNQANTNSNVYSLAKASTSVGNYGVAVTGNRVAAGTVTLPVSLSVSPNKENPVIPDKSNTRPAASLITLTVTVRNVVPGVAYNLYQYNDPTKVPQSNFNANKGNAYKTIAFNVAASSSKRILEGSDIIHGEARIWYRSPTRSPAPQTIRPSKTPYNAPVRPSKTPYNAPVRPSKTPTNVPVKSTTNVPVKSTTNVPVKSPTNVPVKSPTNVPVKSPTNVPVKSPVNIPISTSSPVRTPTSTTTWTTTVTAMSNDKVIFRVVPASAP